MASARDAAVGKECSSEQAGPEGEEKEEQRGEAEQPVGMGNTIFLGCHVPSRHSASPFPAPALGPPEPQLTEPGMLLTL